MFVVEGPDGLQGGQAGPDGCLRGRVHQLVEKGLDASQLENLAGEDDLVQPDAEDLGGHVLVQHHLSCTCVQVVADTRLNPVVTQKYVVQ